MDGSGMRSMDLRPPLAAGPMDPLPLSPFLLAWLLDRFQILC